MTVVTEVVHPHSLNFHNQRKVVIKRDQGMAYTDTAPLVRTVEGQEPTPRTCANVYKNFNRRLGRVQCHYSNCGRKPWKLTQPVVSYLLRRLRELRRDGLCTSTHLQQVLAREKNVNIDASKIRGVLRSQGYRWLPRSKKRQCSKEDRLARMAFARKMLRLSNKDLRALLSMCMDGVVLARPPQDLTDRINFLRTQETHVWRKPSEGVSMPEFDGHDPYKDQVPLCRAVPMWGGVSGDGASIVTFHATKKITVEEWTAAVQAGRLRASLVSINPQNRRGPWTILCDNESFLHSKAAKAAHAKCRVRLLHIPARSPDLNPVEKFWSWLRKELRSRDLRDALAKRPVLGKMAYRARVRSVLKTRKAQRVAANTANGLKKVCRKVIANQGRASGT